MLKRFIAWLFCKLGPTAPSSSNELIRPPHQPTNEVGSRPTSASADTNQRRDTRSTSPSQPTSKTRPRPQAGEADAGRIDDTHSIDSERTAGNADATPIDDAHSIDSERTAVAVRELWSVWPQNDDPEYTDYLHTRLLSICSGRIVQTGSRRVLFWQVYVTEYEALQLQEMEAEEVSETVILFQI